MERAEDVLGARAIIFAWLASALAWPLALLVAALGQGIGAVAGGCSWIGVTTPLTRPVWALVNQPTLDFAHLTEAFGYWWGASLLCLLVGACVVPLLPRPTSIAAELTTLQVAWACTVVGGAWLPLIDLADGHITRWLVLHQLTRELVWLVPLLAAAIGLVPVMRLLALARAARPDLSRATRLTLVLLDLGLPLAAWVVCVSLLRGRVPVGAAVGAVLPLLAALGLAWFRYSRPFLQPRRRLTAGSFVALSLAAAVVAALVLVAGRPLPGDRVSGILWGPELASNNVRTWVEPLVLQGPEQPAPDPS